MKVWCLIESLRVWEKSDSGQKKKKKKQAKNAKLVWWGKHCRCRIVICLVSHQNIIESVAQTTDIDPHSGGGYEVKIKVLPIWFLVRTLSWLQMASFSLCPHMVERESKLPGVFSSKAHMTATLSWLYLILIISQSICLQVLSQWGFNMWNLKKALPNLLFLDTGSIISISASTGKRTWYSSTHYCPCPGKNCFGTLSSSSLPYSKPKQSIAPWVICLCLSYKVGWKNNM